MFWPFHRYFVRYIFSEKTRQRPLFIGLVGLSISSFALLVLQCTMGGLQHNLIERAYKVEGRAVVEFEDLPQEKVQEMQEFLAAQGLRSYPEYEIELLLKWGGQISPVLLHGVDVDWALGPQFKDERPSYIGPDLRDGLILGSDVGGRVSLPVGAQVMLISPAHTDSVLGEVPRQVSGEIKKFVSTGVPQVDLFHLWARQSLVQNLIREKVSNRLRLFSATDFSHLEDELKSRFQVDLSVKTWEMKNASLVYALKLENAVMTFLFVIMTFLVAISITSGLLIFFDKIKLDLVSFWILGASQGLLKKSSRSFLHLLNLLAVILGLGLALIFLYVLDHYMPDIMPAIFVERRIPVHFSVRAFLVSFLIPLGMATVFSFLSLAETGDGEGDYLRRVRSLS